jgi:hypothetical protein
VLFSVLYADVNSGPTLFFKEGGVLPVCYFSVLEACVNSGPTLFSKEGGSAEPGVLSCFYAASNPLCFT